MKRGFFLIALLFASTLHARVETFKYHPSVCKSTSYSVFVNNVQQTVLETGEPDICIFACDEPVTVKIALNSPSECAVVRPLSVDFCASYDNGCVSLTMNPKDRAVVEFDSDTQKPLFIFANRIDDNRPQKGGRGVTVFKSGKVYDLDDYPMSDGQTLYLEGGSFVKGNILTKKAANLTIAGSGVLDGRDVPNRVVFFSKCRNICLRDITVLNKSSWTTYIAESDSVMIDNYKVVAEFSDRHERGLENDALNLISSSNAVINHCFSYCHDDAYCIKTGVFNHQGPSRHISYNDCIAWNVRGGNSMEIGYEIKYDIEDVSYNNMYSIHKRDNERCSRNADISIHNAGRATVRDIRYNNIFLEESDNYTISFLVFDNGNTQKFGYDYTPGAIENVSLNNIHVLYDQPKGSKIYGFDEIHTIKDVRIGNFVVKGNALTDVSSALISVKNASVSMH